MADPSTGNLIHDVKEGDTLVSIADQYGFRNWEIIWNDGKNADLRAKRPDPQILMAGDKVWVPSKASKIYDCETSKKHSFRLKKLAAVFRAQMKDENGVPYANKEYKLSVDSKDFHGKTDGTGLVQEKVPPSAKEGELTLWPDPDNKRVVLSWKLKLGHLDPSGSITGVQARLTNLGYYGGPADGTMNSGTKAALAAFQADNGINPANGELNSETSAKLGSVHDVGGPAN